MTKTLEKKKLKHYRTKVSSSKNDPEIFGFSGEEYERAANEKFSLGKYRESFSAHRNAARCYKGALERLDADSGEYQNVKTMYGAARRGARIAALYEATEKTPIILRSLIRKLKGWHIFSCFIFSLFFSISNFTGQAVEWNIKGVSFVGLSLFLLGLLLSYFYTQKKILMVREINL